ncbi:hypothetical protein COO60DRAFT_1624406 [Scenedesmus sp. NREL 46B-D3]|nr:hypothetical protein COO60DRAFT_1624406 [Scenedesmus sp. NREL 46B-D3]
MPGGHETAYLVDTVGQALSKAVAATVTAQPADPVEYLAEWLLRQASRSRQALLLIQLSYVMNEQQQVVYLKEKKKHIDEEKHRVAQDLEEQKQQEAAEAARKAAVDGLASMSSEPLLLWQAAVRLVKSYTSAASVYVANIVDEEQPDWAPPDDPEADAETDDEDAAAAAGTDGDGAEAGEGGAGQEDAETDGEGGDGEAHAADGADGTAGKFRVYQVSRFRRFLAHGCMSASGSVLAGAGAAQKQLPVSPILVCPAGAPGLQDYSAKLLRYVAASPGQEFLTRLELRRSTQAEQEAAAEAGQQPQQVPVTFKILEEHVPLLEVPAVTAEPRVKFLRGFPRIGGYIAAAVPAGPAGPAGGSYHAVLAADTLLPDGHGQALTQQEVGFLWDVAQALGKALDAAAAARRAGAARGGSAEVLGGLAAAIAELRKATAPAAALPEVDEEPAAPEQEEGAELAPADLILQREAELQHIHQRIAAGQVAADNAAAGLTLERNVLEAVVQSIRGVRGAAIHALKLFSSSPPATQHVLRAVLLLLERDPAALSSWREVLGQLHVGTFDDLAAYDATQARDAALWKRVRAAYKAVQRSRDLEKELPQCALGALLMQWLKQVRCVARKAAALRDASAALQAAREALCKKEQQLEEAKEAKLAMNLKRPRRQKS